MMEVKDHPDGRIPVWVDPEIAPLVPLFLQNRHQDIVTMLHALEAGDFETVRRLGHSMKGSGGGYGFDPITEIGGAIEQAAIRGDMAAVRHHVDALRTYLARLEVMTDERPPVR